MQAGKHLENFFCIHLLEANAVVINGDQVIRLFIQYNLARSNINVRRYILFTIL